MKYAALPLLNQQRETNFVFKTVRLLIIRTNALLLATGNKTLRRWAYLSQLIALLFVFGGFPGVFEKQLLIGGGRVSEIMSLQRKPILLVFITCHCR